jgi:Tfp pilus assembly protein PilF
MNEDPERLFALGAAALDRGDYPAAEQLFGSIVARHPGAHPAWNALSVVAVRAGAPDIAVEHARHALALERRNPVYLNNLGVALGELGMFPDAEASFRRALQQRPVYAEALYNLGKVLHKQGRLDDATRALERGYAMEPQFPGLRATLARIYRLRAEAGRAMEVLQASPDRGENDELGPQVAACIAELDGEEHALQWLREVIARQPGMAAVRFALALMLLSVGQWREGWREYVWRGNILGKRDGAPPLPLPRDLKGKHVLLLGEQGVGDVLFFLRFAEELRARGAVPAVACEAKLATLLKGCVARFEKDEQAPADFRVWLGDLPAVLESEATPPALALAVDPVRRQQARERLALLGPAPYLGITWRAGTDVLRRQEFGHDRAALSKEMPPEELGAAVRGWPGTLVALQRGPYAGELEAAARGAGAAVHDVTLPDDDLEGSLAMLCALDEYAGVSSTNVHLLAGAGRTGRILVPYPPEFRWMRREGESDWFPGFPVYRQGADRDWSKPLAKLRQDLVP